ncbi:protein lifeguard 4-like [Centruroides sculpturatus]|uniref:protein lifeguard 4-like n=1 Tax=Centruroides sculpturatus TaxID=218467 RepID=UPI000C6D324E|nr:protein lifeguard 4-like [Centruroides sculpturatus]
MTIEEKHLELANRKGIVFHQDNRSNTSLQTCQKLLELSWNVLPPHTHLIRLPFVRVIIYYLSVTFYDQLAVLQAFFLTLCVTISLTLFTFQSKYDVSSWGGGLFSILCILSIGMVLQMFTGSTQMELFLSIGGAILFSLFIIYDTHMIMHRLSPEEYILASIDLYLDIINLFFHLLRILSHSRKS